jgi:hypothetical protein
MAEKQEPTLSDRGFSAIHRNVGLEIGPSAGFLKYRIHGSGMTWAITPHANEASRSRRHAQTCRTSEYQVDVNTIYAAIYVVL